LVSTDPRTGGNAAEVATSPDARLDLLKRWVERIAGESSTGIHPASADASFRRYFRVTLEGETRIVMDAPPDKEDVGPFIRVADMLGAIGVNAPQILARNLEEGFLLLTDLGGRTYLKDLERGENVDSLYLDAMAALVRIQAGGRQFGPHLPAYDEALLLREMQLLPDWFLDKHLRLTLDAAETTTLREGFALLAAEALAQPRTFVHRDYHSRNLMIATEAKYGRNPGILDFQDAVFGPITYDLVSMLRDCYVAWPQERVAAWVGQYRHLAREAGLDVGNDSATFTRWFDWMGVQRHLKAIGIFARLWHRDGKPGYLGDIPRTLGYVVDVTSRYPQLHPLNRLLEARVLPALAAVTR
jgi:aminoglycoside/choline kinase family phosphotransferase